MCAYFLSLSANNKIQALSLYTRIKHVSCESSFSWGYEYWACGNQMSWAYLREIQNHEGDLNTGQLVLGTIIRNTLSKTKNYGKDLNTRCLSGILMLHSANKNLVTAYICHPCDSIYMLWTEYK